MDPRVAYLNGFGGPNDTTVLCHAQIANMTDYTGSYRARAAYLCGNLNETALASVAKDQNVSSILNATGTSVWSSSTSAGSPIRYSMTSPALQSPVEVNFADIVDNRSLRSYDQLNYTCATYNRRGSSLCCLAYTADRQYGGQSEYRNSFNPAGERTYRL